MYLDFYKLKEKPFQITTDPKFLWLGEKHKEAVAILRYGILDNRGFLLLTGEVGTGKTVMINHIASLLDIDTVVATLPDPDLESMDFYNLLADGLNMNRTFESKGAFLIHLRDFLHESYANHQQVLLIIDESQRLNHRLMEDIRVLSNIELHDRKLINIFFVGQQEFNSILMTPQNRALAQRITVRYHLEPLSLDETGLYIAHRLKVAGSTKPIFKPIAIEKIYHFSGGIPRLINIISDHAMLTGYARDVQQLDDKIINECAQELRIPVTSIKSDAAIIQSPVGVTASTGKGSKPHAQKKESAMYGPNGPQIGAGSHGDGEPQALSWKLVYACVVLLLVGLVAFGVTQFTGNNPQRFEDEELTPQKYKSTLEREKALLTSQMKVQKSIDDQAKPNGNDRRAPINRDKSEDEKSIQQKQLEPLPLIDEKVLIQFKINSNEIDPDSYVAMDRIADYLVRHPEGMIFVRGYTDTMGSSGYNVSVSGFRASAVKSYLVGKGVDSEKIKVFAMGDQNPLASNTTIEGRQANRRVEIEIPSLRTPIN
jgi:general secretion pathway protein A